MKESYFQVLLFGLIVVFTFIIFLGQLFLSDLQFVSHWGLTIIIFFIEVVVYFFLRKIFKGLVLGLGMIFFSFALYPSLAFEIYSRDNTYYEISDGFLNNQKTIALRELRNMIPISKMIKIQAALITDSLDNIAEEIRIPEIVKFRNNNNFMSLSNPYYSFTLNDTLETRIYIDISPDLPVGNKRSIKDDIIEGLKHNINRMENLMQVASSSRSAMPYSEFYTESVTSFSSGQIKPARNLSKTLNSLQLLSILFLTTMLINTISEGKLSITKKKTSLS